MLNKLLDIFKTNETSEEPMDPALAAAALMFEVVWADHDVAPLELESMSNQLKALFDNDASKIDTIMAQTQANHDASVGVFPFTRAINEQLDQEQKFQILTAMWRIALADNDVDVFEEHTIRRIADLLYVPHAKFIEAKLSARNPST